MKYNHPFCFTKKVPKQTLEPHDRYVLIRTFFSLVNNKRFFFMAGGPLKSAVFGLSLSLPLLVSEGGGLVCELVGKADLLSDHFDSKQSREAVDMPLTCYLSPSLATFAFRSREVRHLLLDLDPYGGNDQLGIFPLFLKRTDVMAPHLSVVFQWPVCLGSSLPCWS